jgi:hypothetical protein
VRSGNRKVAAAPRAPDARGTIVAGQRDPDRFSRHQAGEVRAMNCGEFEALVGDLARGHGPEESERRAATAHARECANCSSRLVEERELAGLLGLFAASVAGRAAPTGLEAALLDAFARQHALPATRRRPLSLPRWAFVAAAALALVTAAAWLLRPRPVLAPRVVAKSPIKAPLPVAVAPAPPVVQRAAQPRRKRPPHREVAATQFYPLAPVDAGARIQGATIVRIGMPRRALASFGWPVDPDDSGGAVEAEVVLDGDTGMARAIRFVGSRQ